MVEPELTNQAKTIPELFGQKIKPRTSKEVIHAWETGLVHEKQRWIMEEDALSEQKISTAVNDAIDRMVLKFVYSTNRPKLCEALEQLEKDISKELFGHE